MTANIATLEAPSWVHSGSFYQTIVFQAQAATHSHAITLYLE